MKIDEIEDFSEILDITKKHGAKCAFSWKEHGEIKKVNFEEFNSEIRNVMAAIQDFESDVKNIILLSEKSYCWFVCLFAIVCSGKNVILLCNYDKNSEYHNLCKADMVLYDQKKERQVKNMQEKCFPLKACPISALDVKTKGRPNYIAGGEIIIYTSGTTHDKRPVILSQRNLSYCAYKTIEGFSYWEKSRFVSFLPCDHVFDFVVSLYVLLIGSEQYILKKVGAMDECNEYKPDVVAMIPFMINEFVFNTALKKSMPFFKEVKVIVTGGASLDNMILDMLEDSGYKVFQGYGCTECPVIALNRSGDKIPSNAGKKLSGSEIKIINGQICVKSEAVCVDYWGDYEVNKEGEWLKTGDAGYFVEETGCVYITGRKTNCIVLSNGRNVYPEQLEGMIESNKCIKAAVIYAKKIVNRDFLYADIYPSGAYNRLVEKKEIEVYMKQINEKLPIYMKLQGYMLKYDSCELNDMGKKKLVMRYRESGK